MIYLPLFSGKRKQIKLVHRYGTYDVKDKYEIIATLGYDNVLRLYLIDTELLLVKKQVSVPYYFKLLKAFDNSVKPIIEMIDGFWYFDDTNRLRLTLFVFARIKGYVFTLLQLDYLDLFSATEDVSHYRVWHEFESCERFVAGVLMKERLIFTDFKSVDSVDTYIMYVDYSNHTLDNKWIQGYHVLVSEDEKQDFMSKHNGIQVDPVYPYVNFVDKPIVLYKLPQKSEKVQFQFTSGLLYVRFTEPDELEYEQFKV